MWVVRALGPEEIESQFVRAVGADYVVPSSVPTKVFIADSTLEPGVHLFQWIVGTDNAGRPLPSGFYRVFIYSKGPTTSFSSHHDMLLWLSRDCNLAPPDLRPYLHCDY